MSTQTDPDEPRALVRRFSGLVAINSVPQDGSNSMLRRIIAGDYDRERVSTPEDRNWERHFQVWKPVTTNERSDLLLRPDAVKLSVTWNRFVKKVPHKDAASWQHRAPDFKDVFDLMENISSQFEKDRNRGATGIVNKYFRRSCDQLKAHDNLLSILPDGSEYVSLFTGVLKSIIQASCNHETVLAAFAKSWAEISEKVSYLEDVLDMYPTKKIQELMMGLYGDIFSYLGNALDWYLATPWTRVRRAFNQDLYEEYKEQISGICERAQDIKDRMLLGQGAQLHGIQDDMHDVKRDLADMKTWRFEQEQKRKRIEIPELRHQSKSELMGFISSQFKGVLQQFAEDAAVGAAQRLQSENGITAAGTSSMMTLIEIPANGEQQHRKVARFPVELQLYFEKDRIRFFSRPTASSLPDEVAARLHRWVKDDNSAIISISGDDPYSDSWTPGSLSRSAANLIAFADLARLPVVSYFCARAKPTDLQSAESRQSRGLIAVVYALIWQLVELTPSETETNIDLSAERFDLLDGTTKTFPMALDILRDAFHLAPQLLYCVVDGLHWLDDKSTKSLLDSFVGLLVEMSDNNGVQAKQIKILLTTAGSSRAVRRSAMPRRNQIVLE